MLTGKLVRVHPSRNRIVPYYLDVSKAEWHAAAERLLELFRGQEGRTRGELEQDVTDVIGNDAGQLVYRGLAKLLQDRCEFEVVSGMPPEQVREAVFAAAADFRRGLAENEEAASIVREGPTVDRAAVLEQVAATLGLTAAEVDHSLFADLKCEQRLIRFKDTTAERLLNRYNVALAQAVLLRSTAVHVAIRGESPQRYRQLFRLVKFRRLLCEAERTGPDSFLLHLDGPLSLFTATQKYGLQLALFLPAVLNCRDFELDAQLSWGPQRKPRHFKLSSGEGLVSHAPDHGMHVPPEVAMFANLFAQKVGAWQISEETEVLPLGEGHWVPDYRLTHRATGQTVYLEVLGYWRRGSVEKHLQRLRQHARQPFLLAVSDRLHVEDVELESLPAGVHRFRQMPLPDEIARLAEEALTALGTKEG